MSWFYLALLAPLLYAIVNLIDDNLLNFVYKSPYLATVSAGFYGALPLLSRFFLPSHKLPTNLAFLAVFGGVLTLTYIFFYFKSLQVETPSVVVALFGLAPATIPILAHFFVHEHLTALEILGFLIVLSASLGLAVDNIHEFKFSKALWPMIIAVIFMDAATLMTKYDYQRADFYSVYLYFSAGMAIGGIFFWLIKMKENKRGLISILPKIKKLLPILIAAEIIAVTAELTLNLAISRGPVSLVKVIEGIQPMYVLLIALILYPFRPKFFREAESGHIIRKFILMAIIIAGLTIIGLASQA
ncbi:MAG TPA: EamA family transporter [Candidatus Saccharimonadales bacterium]|nr:EamA family transporter [Candidatus Saccharimonadales bacterium]